MTPASPSRNSFMQHLRFFLARPALLRPIAPLLAVAALTALLPACGQFGPRFIEASRTDYNIAMNTTEGEQMLLNLVRLRYGDSPYFLEASALNTQFLIAPSATISSSFDFNGNNSYGLGGRLAYEEKPTVTYVPLRGQEFVRQVLSRVSLETVLLLDASGWSTERVLRLCVEKMNGLDNAARASGPTPTEAPDVDRFRRAIGLLADFESHGDLVLFRKQVGEHAGFVARFADPARQSAAFKELSALLGLDPGISEYAITLNQVTDSRQTINFATRSFMGVMYFLAQSVEVPTNDIDAGRVTVTEDSAGQAFDWAEVTGGLMKIASSKKRPGNIAVAVNYRGLWFYIDDSDLQSKSTFSLLEQLYALQSDGDSGNAPILTLPIGG
jgi:hypothetical protein